MPAIFGNLELIAQAPAIEATLPVFKADYTAPDYIQGLEHAKNHEQFTHFYTQQKEAEHLSKLAQIHLDMPGESTNYGHRPAEFPERLDAFKPFTDTGKNLQPGDPSSWTLPTKENYKGWMPGDPINPLTWATDSSLYIQEIMKQNFVTDADGKRVSIFELDKRYKQFKDQFGNAARHALGVGDLIFEKNMKPKDAETGMYLHEPTGWAGGALKSALAISLKPYQDEMKDSDADIRNNAYAVKQSSRFHGFESFARQMLTDSWKSATKGSLVIEDGQK